MPNHIHIQLHITFTLKKWFCGLKKFKNICCKLFSSFER